MTEVLAPEVVAHPGDPNLAETKVAPRFSPSQLFTWENCPRSWAAKYVGRVPDPAGLPAVVGSAAHHVLELLHEVPDWSRDIFAARAIARDVWPEWQPQLAAEADGRPDIELKRMVWAGVEGLWALEDPMATDVVSTERKLQVELGGVPLTAVVDRVDQVDGGLAVRDYKSGKPGKFATPKATRQVLLYAGAVELVDEVPVVEATVLYTTHKKLIPVEVTDDAVAGEVHKLAVAWQARTRAVDQALEVGAYPASPGPLCAWCPWLDNCSEGRAQVAARQSNPQPWRHQR